MAYRLNLTVDQGSSYSNTLVLSQNNDPSWPLPANTTYLAQLRDYYTDPLANTQSFVVSVAQTTVNNVVYPAVTLSLTANQTGNLTSQNYVWDLCFQYANGTLTRIREGYIFVDAGVTDVVPASDGNNTSVQYNLLSFTYGNEANGTPGGFTESFLFGEFIYQTANGVTTSNVTYTYNTAIATITSVNSTVITVDTVMGTWQANQIFHGASSNASANLVSIAFQ